MGINLIDYAKRLGIEIPGTSAAPVDKEAGKAGYEKYLADTASYQAELEKRITEENSKKSFWNKATEIILQANQISNQMTNDPISTSFNQAVEAYKNVPMDNKPSDDWTDEERWAFGEKYAVNASEAYAFAKQINDSKAQKKKEQQQEAIANWTSRNVVNRALGSAASLALNAGWGYAGYLDALAQKAAGRDTIQQDILMPHEVAETMQGSVAGHLNDKYGTLNENVPILGGKGLGDVYSLGMSIGQSALSGATGGTAGTLVQFFGMSASQGVSDALSRGASADQALAFGTMSGLAEAIPEMISVKSLLGIASAEGVQNLFKSVLKQAGEEAKEELTTSIITEVADRWIMGGKSQFQMRVNELVAGGMDIAQAEKTAWTETIENIAFDTISGAMSGGISGAGAVGVNRVNQQFFQKEANETAKKALSPEASKLIEEAKKYDSTKKRAEALEKKVAEGKELTGYELRMLVSQLTEASRNADVDTVRKAIVEKMKSEGVSDSMAKTLGEIALNKAIGNEVSKVQDLMLKRNENALKVYNQISEEMMESGLGDSEWAQNTPIQRLRAEKRANEQPDTEQRVHSGIERLKAELGSSYENKLAEVDNKIVYKPSENSKIHVDGISSSLTHEDMIELSAIEKIANELGVDIHVYETKVDNKTGERVYTDKDGKRYSDSGFYDSRDNSIHIDLRAGENGEGTMLYTASHELVHFIKKNAPEHYAALEELVTKELVKGGFSIDQLVEEQRKKDRNGLTDEELREEVVAEACQSFLASKNAVAEIQALKTENKGLWTALKKFFTSLFNNINKVYKTVPPDSAEGKYIADMRKAIKPIRDAFMEGVVEAAKNQSKTNNAVIRHQARIGTASDGKKIFKSNFPKGTPKAAKSERILGLIQNVWSKKPISLVISNGETSRTILAQFDPTIDENKIIPTDASKIAGGNRHGNHTEQRVTLDLADDYYEIASDAKYNYSKKETGKKLNTHNDVNMWHYFFTEIYFMEQEGDAYTPYTVTVNVKEKDDGDFVYSFNAEKEPSTRQTLHADVITYKGDNGELFLDNRIAQKPEVVNPESKIRSKSRTITAKDSLGNELSAEQQEYFKDSAVRDKKGNLLVLYHGTTADFNTFKKGDVGFHFGTKGAARGRAGYGKNVNLKEVYLNITNPIVFDEDLGSWDADYRLTEELYNRGIITQEEAESVLLTDSKQYRRTTEQANKKLASLLLDKGYDGIEYTNTHETQKPTTSYIVFDSSQAKDINNLAPTLSKDIRHKSRSTVTSVPYISPTATSIVTNIDSGYDYTRADKISSGITATQIAFTNAQAGIESIAKKYGVKNIESLVQAARTASHQAEEMISGNQYRIGSDTKTYLGEGLQKIFSPIEEKGEEVTQAFFDYLFHYHNADRMSLEQRSIEWNEEKKKEHQNMMKRFAELQKEQTNFYKEKAALTRKKSDSARRQEINQRLAEIKREISSVTKLIKKTQAEIDSFVPLKNKAVIGLNRAEIIAKKEELSKQIDGLIAQKKSLGRNKKNAAEVTEISLKIGELIAERDSLSAEVTADKSKEIIAEYEKNYDYFREVAEKIWQYNRNLNQYRVDTGLINQEQYDYLEKLYPHYVPSYRADVSTGIAAVKGKNNLAISQSIKTATGSTKDLLNPIVIMARQTMETIRAGRINQIAEALYNGAGQDKTYLAEISRKKVKKSEVVDIDPTELRPKANQVTFFKNGERIVLQVSSEIFAGFDAFAPAFDIKNPLVRFVAGGTDLFKKLVTSANPVFLIRNAVRDLQDAGINTKYAKSFMNNYKEAIKQISENGELWKLYKAMGGSNASYFDFDKGFLAEQNKRGFSKKIEDPDAGKLKSAWQTAQRFTQMMENANSFVEALPRLAEFISSIQAGNTAEQAMLDAADVTTNFARTGKITRALNSTVIPFLNPAIQGASKAVRNVASVRSMREAAILAAKATLLGIAPFLLNALLYSDDEDYEDLRDTDKENNYLIKFGDVFVKIPRGRMASVLAGATNRSVKEIFTDEKVDWGDYLKNVSTQMNPLENMARTIFSPFLDVANNVTWYGSAIEGREFENKSPKDRFDEGTSSIAIAIGKALNYSPKKIHYLIDQYSGVIGDFILPATTKKAERGFLSGNFTIDPVTANKLSDDFYDMYYDVQYAKSADPNDKIAEYQVKHLNRVKSSISELFKAKDEIQNSNLSDREKRAETEAIQILINEAYKTALTDFELITNAIKATSSVDDKYRYAEVLRLVYGSETALKEYDEKVYAKSTILNEVGLSYDVFYKYYFSTRDITSDKDNKGNTITGSKKQKTIEAINKINTTEEKRLMLIAISGYSFDEEKDKQKLLKYVNSLKLSSKTKLALADLLGFEYKNGKIYP